MSLVLKLMRRRKSDPAPDAREPRKIDKPTVIAAASKDLMPTFQDMQKRIPGSKIETFNDAGHALFVDDAEKFNILLEEFITTLK